MSTITSEIRLRIRAEGDKVLADLGAKLNSLANQATISSTKFGTLAAELKQVQATTVQSTNNLKAYSASWRELAGSVDIASKEFKQATAEAARLDAQVAKAQGTKSRGGRLAGAAQTAGAIAASGVFGGPEGVVGAGIGAAFGPQGALVGGAIGAQVGILRQSLGATGEYVAELSKLRIALSGVSRDQADYEKNLSSITTLSNQFLIPLKDTTQQYTKLQASVVGAGMQSKVTETVFKGISAATLATGGSVEDLNASLRATAQVFSKGKVSAEELRQQIGERLPGAFTIFASSIGKTPQELDKALEDGKVTLQDFEKFSKELFRRYGKTAQIIADAPQNAGARLTIELDKLNIAMGRFIQPIGATFQSLGAEILKGLTPALEAFANLIDAPKQLASERLKQLDRQLAEKNQALLESRNYTKTLRPGPSLFRTISEQEQKSYESSIKTLKAERLLNIETAKQTGAAVEDAKLQKKLEEDRKVTSIREKALISLRELEQKTINDLADLREKQIKRALDLERQIGDQRLKAERDLQDAIKQFQDSQQDFQYTTKLGDLQSSGQSTDALKAAKDASDITRDSQKVITQLQRDRDDKTQERQRTLENFKKTNAEEVGRIQLNYTRQSANILEKTGDQLKAAMKEGAKEFKNSVIASVRKYIRSELGLPARTPEEDLVAPPAPKLPAPTQAPRSQVQPFARRPGGQNYGVNDTIPASATKITVSPFRGVENASAQLGTAADAATAQQILNERQQTLEKFSKQINDYLQPLDQQKKSLEEQLSDRQRMNELIRGGTLPALAEEYLQIEKSGQKRKDQLEALGKEVAESATLKGLTDQQLAGKDSLLLKINNEIAGNDALIASTKALVAENAKVRAEKEKIKQTTDQIAESLGSGVGQAIDLLIEGSETLGESLQNIAVNILKDIAKQISQTFVVQPLVSGLKTVLGNLFAGGGVMTEMGPMPLKKYARGGIATGPQMALYGEGSQNEAYVPLPDGRRIPVAMQGGGGGATSVVVNVDAKGSNVEGDTPKGEQLGRALSQAVQAELLKQKRPGGLLS